MKLIVFLVNHRDELTGRCKMKLKKSFPLFWMTFIGFLDILGRNRVKLPEFGGHRTEFGGACIVRTQDSRKSIFFTWIINKSVYKSFLDEFIPWSILTGHKQPSPEIWFETENFKILCFRAPSSNFCPFTSLAWNDSREQLSWILEICKVELESTRRDEQKP